MLDLLHAAERDLPELLASSDGWRSFKLEHHPPVVERMLRSYRDGKLFLHRIHPSDAAIRHPHPWPSALRLVDGRYELELGCGATVAARLIATAPFEYEMIDADAWHAVRPIGAPALTIMVTGPRWQPLRKPLHDDPSLAPLTDAEAAAMLADLRRHYPR
jgi:hypothetical protein